LPRDTSIRVEGLRDLERALSRIQKEYGGNTAVQAMRPAIKAAMNPLVGVVQAATPELTGDLQGSTRLKIGKPTRKMVSVSEHYSSKTVAYGQVGWFWRGRSMWYQALAVEYGTQSQPANYALRGAIEGRTRAIINRFKNTLGPSIEKKAAAAARKRNK